MSSAPFDTGLVIARLKAQVPELRQVRASAEYAAVNSMSGFAPPEAFVLLTSETGGDLAGNSRQAARAVFGVVTAARNYSDATGAAALDAARPLIGKIRAALIGWTPESAAGIRMPGARPIEWSQGHVMDYDAGTVLWADVFSTQQFIGNRQ